MFTMPDTAEWTCPYEPKMPFVNPAPMFNPCDSNTFDGEWICSLLVNAPTIRSAMWFIAFCRFFSCDCKPLIKP